MVGASSNELIDEVRRYLGTFRSLCPDAADGFSSWWRGEPPGAGTTSQFVVIDPVPRRGSIVIATLDEALTSQPRHSRYADIARKLGP